MPCMPVVLCPWTLAYLQARDGARWVVIKQGIRENKGGTGWDWALLDEPASRLGGRPNLLRENKKHITDGGSVSAIATEGLHTRYVFEIGV